MLHLHNLRSQFQAVSILTLLCSQIILLICAWSHYHNTAAHDCIVASVKQHGFAWLKIFQVGNLQETDGKLQVSLPEAANQETDIWHISIAVQKTNFKFLPIDFPSEATNPSQLQFQCHHKNVQLKTLKQNCFPQHGSCSLRADTLESDVTFLCSPVWQTALL